MIDRYGGSVWFDDDNQMSTVPTRAATRVEEPDGAVVVFFFSTSDTNADVVLHSTS
jgi:hypothetical protein